MPDAADVGPRDEDQSAHIIASGARALPERPIVTALAERLATRADSTSGPARASSAMLAAELYARLWRVEHSESDARRAISLFGAAEKVYGDSRGQEVCTAMSARSQLEAELSHDARALFEAQYSGARQYVRTECATAMDAATRMLAAYQPGPARVAELAAAAERRRAEVTTDLDHARVVQSDEAGVVVAPVSVGDQPSRVVTIAPYSAHDRARVVVRLSAAAKFEVLSREPERRATRNHRSAGPHLFLDLPHTLGSGQPEPVVRGLVTRIREVQDPDRLRIVLDLAESAHRRVFFLPEPFRIVIDLAQHGPSWGMASVTKRPIVERVVLDPGHGGPDPGAVGPSGLMEKDVTLDIAHRAAPLLSRELGVQTMLTRDTDRLVSLDERTARANAFHADLFVSIHCNASENTNGRGVTTFVLDATRDDASAEIAARENSTSILVSPEAASVARSISRSDVRARSLHFAELLQRASMASLAPDYRDTSDLGVRTAGFFVLVGAEMPGVLYETSFISNPVEEKRFATLTYRQKFADAIVNAVRALRQGR